jgi:hypothetical protein
MTLRQQIDYMRKLTRQSRPTGLRVLYTKAGTRLSAVRLTGGDTIVDTSVYWASVHSHDEAGYLISVINSGFVLGSITDLQPHGQRDKRHFDKLIWTLPIPEFDAGNPVHRALAEAARRAEEVAARVELDETQHFTAKRRAIRAALAADGVAVEIEALVGALLPS